jgi:hypothetical protein
MCEAEYISLSMCEAEYIALSMCYGQLIPPMRFLLDKLSKLLKVPSITSPLNGLGSSIILEDNAAALALGNNGK